MTSYCRPFPFCWLIVLFLAFFCNLNIFEPVRGNETTINEEKINLKIEETFSLINESFKEFDRSFGLFQKQDFYFLNIKCRSTENNIKKVVIMATLNGVITKKTFWDSTQNNSAFHSFIAGSTLTLKLDESTPIYYLKNKLRISIQLEMISFFMMNEGNFTVEEVIFHTLTPPTITPETTEEIDLPLEESQGEWYISPLAILSERSLETRIFAYISEDIPLRISVKTIPTQLPVSGVSISILANQKSFQNNAYSGTELYYIIHVYATKNAELAFKLQFRPSSGIVSNILAITLNVTVSVVPSSDSESTIGKSQFPDLFSVPTIFLETIRISAVVIPLMLFYKRKKSSKIKNNSFIGGNEL